MAPRHPTTKKLIDDFSKEHPELQKAQKEKDENLAKMLRGLTVTPEKMGEFSTVKKKQTLPMDRSKVVDEEFGYLEPEVIRPGRCTIRQALQFIGDHYTDSTSNSPSSIASEYKLDAERVQHVLKHFHVFHVQMPQQKSASKDTSLIGEAKALKPQFFDSLTGKDSTATDAVQNAGKEK